MAKDRFLDRFRRKTDKDNLDARAHKQMGQDAMDEEERILAETPPVETIHSDQHVKRNDPCPCGSGKKYKKCCGAK